jgi:hypothetical protein
MSAMPAAPDWLRGVVLPEPERGPRGERVVSYEAVAQAVAMADAAMKAKTRAAQRSALAAASLGFQKGVAASQAAMAQQARASSRAPRRASRHARLGAVAPRLATQKKRRIALRCALCGGALRASLPRAGALLACAPASLCFRACDAVYTLREPLSFEALIAAALPLSR